ncbi:MAG: hypothetical protein JST19_07170 [Bacteroidetes bacterium]|nr:hypothetical protein [Bacteroidota bacterium]
MHYPFDTTGMAPEQINLFQETYEVLKTKFEIEPTGDIDFHLDNFEVFRGWTDVNTRSSFVIKNARSNCYILFIEAHKRITNFRSVPPTYDRFEYQVWALAYAKKDFGRVLIRPETLADKLIELVHPVELDFDDDKAFSDTFYVLVNDRWKADIAMDRNFRNIVMDMRHEDVVIEVIDHTLIIGYGKPTSPNASVQLADFVVRVASLC